MPFSAAARRRLPSNAKGLVTTPTVNAPTLAFSYDWSSTSTSTTAHTSSYEYHISNLCLVISFTASLSLLLHRFVLAPAPRPLVTFFTDLNYIRFRQFKHLVFCIKWPKLKHFNLVMVKSYD